LDETDNVRQQVIRRVLHKSNSHLSVALRRTESPMNCHSPGSPGPKRESVLRNALSFAGGAEAPFDALGDYLRGTKGSCSICYVVSIGKSILTHARRGRSHLADHFMLLNWKVNLSRVSLFIRFMIRSGRNSATGTKMIPFMVL